MAPQSLAFSGSAVTMMNHGEAKARGWRGKESKQKSRPMGEPASRNFPGRGEL